MQYTLTNSNLDSWVIENNYNKIVFQDYRTSIKYWSSIFKEDHVKFFKDILLVNDAAQIFKNSFSHPCSLTLVDKDSYALCEEPFSKYLNTVPFIKDIDSLGYERKLVLIDDTFEDAYVDNIFKIKYDAICLNVLSEADLSIQNLENYFMLLKDFGYLYIQVPNEILNIKSINYALQHYFTMLSVKPKSFVSTNSIQSFIYFRKISSLV